jgi:predicted DNA binding CopG/RHH family protein
MCRAIASAADSRARLLRSTPTGRPELLIKGNAMKKNSNGVAAEAAFAADLYKNRAEINRKAQDVLATSRQITIRLNNSETALAKQQAEAKGLKYQTYIKMLLHEALVKHG